MCSCLEGFICVYYPACSHTTKTANLQVTERMLARQKQQYTRIRKWTAGVKRKEMLPSVRKGSGGTDVQRRKTKKGILRTKSHHFAQIARLRNEPVAMVTIEEGGLRVVRGDGTAGAQTDARRVCVCAYPRGVSSALRSRYFGCLCFPLRVIDNLESFSFPEWQIRSGAWLIVI